MSRCRCDVVAGNKAPLRAYGDIVNSPLQHAECECSDTGADRTEALPAVQSAAASNVGCVFGHGDIPLKAAPDPEAPRAFLPPFGGVGQGSPSLTVPNLFFLTT